MGVIQSAVVERRRVVERLAKSFYEVTSLFARRRTRQMLQQSQPYGAAELSLDELKTGKPVGAFRIRNAATQVWSSSINHLPSGDT